MSQAPSLSISRQARFHDSSTSPTFLGLGAASAGEQRFSLGPQQRKCFLAVCPGTMKSQASGLQLRTLPHGSVTSRGTLHQEGSGSSRLGQADKTAECIQE